MRFTGKVLRDNRIVPIDGNVSGDIGTFNFNIADAASIWPGPATVITDNSETWNINITSTTSSAHVAREQCTFWILGRALRTTPG